MLGAGTGAEIRQPLGYAMVGGLIVSQALTLFTTPVVYIYLDKLASFLDRLFGSKSPQPIRDKAKLTSPPLISIRPAPHRRSGYR